MRLVMRTPIYRLLWIVALLTPIATPSHAQVGAIGFGVALDRALDRVNDLVNNARNSGLMLEVAAGGQIATAILNAKLAYEDGLNKTEAAYSREMQATLTSINSSVSQLEAHAFTSLDQATKRAQTIVNSLPFSKEVPQVAAFAPTYFVPTAADPNLFNLDGNFIAVTRSSKKPTLLVGTTPITSLILTTTEMGFAVPGGALAPPGAGTSYTPAKLSIPYKSRCYLVLRCKRIAEFQFLFIGLPQSPGKLTFVYTTQAPAVVRQTVESPEKSQESDDDDFKDFQHCWAPDAGWRVVPASVERIVTWEQGDEGNDRDWWWNNNTSNIANACWNLTTIHHTVGTSGKVHFRLRFAEEKDVTQPTDNPTTVDLDWASSRSFQVPPGSTWRAEFERFDGKKTQIIDNQVKDPYLRVSVLGGAVTFITVP